MRQVTAAIIEDSGRFLLARRSSHSKFAGTWEFPGGKIEPSESPEECLKRELKEELDVEVEVGTMFAESVFEHEHGCFQILAFRTRIVGGTMTLMDHDQIVWAAPSELLNLAVLPADVPIARKFQENLNGRCECLHSD